MLNFNPIEAEDIPQILPYLEFQNFRTCDYTIGGFFMWRKFFQAEYAICEETLFFKTNYFDEGTCFTFPVGKNNINDSLKLLENYVKENNLKLKFCTVPTPALDLLKQRYKESLSEFPLRNWFDYLYDINDFIFFTGKKYSTQRNHLNKFKSLYPSYKFGIIDNSNIHRVNDFLKTFEDSFDKDSPLAIEEFKRTIEIIEYFEHFNFIGGYIEVEQKIIAISIGEIVNDTLFVHVEKALKEYQGVYQVMVNEFSKYAKTDLVLYANREEDVGDPGLRKSKLSYHPLQLLEKYLVSVDL